MIGKTARILRAFVWMALAFAPAVASAEMITEHKTDDDWSEWYWTTNVLCVRGEAHTFSITGLTERTAITDLSVVYTYRYVEDGETNEVPYEASESYESEDYSAKYVLLTKGDWSDIPGTGDVSFTVRVDGWEPDEDQTTEDLSFVFRHSAGDGDSPVSHPRGSEGNPVDIPIAESNTVQNYGKVLWEKPGGWDASDQVDGCVYLVTSPLTAGRKYVFGFKGLASGTTVSMTGDAGSELLTDDGKCDVFAACDGYCWTVVPETDGVHTIAVGDDSEDFFCKFAVYATRKPADHADVDYGDGDPDAHFGTLAIGGTSEPFAPGYLNHPESGAVDEVIDGKLFELTGLAGGADYVFETQTAAVDLVMRLYDGEGNVLAENLYAAEGGQDTRIAWTAPTNLAAEARYYVGVCEKLETGAEPKDGEITLTARRVEIEDNGEKLELVPTTESGSPFDATDAKPSAASALSATCWTNTYSISVRKGVEYHVKARLTEDGSSNGLVLGAKVYALAGTAETVLKTDGDLDPAADADCLVFTSPTNGTVFVAVAVADGDWGNGMGLDYGPFEVCAVASGEYGILHVDMTGATEGKMEWKILSVDGEKASGEPFYPAAESVIVPAGSYTLLAKGVSGFATPDAGGFGPFDVVAEETATAVYKYSDKYDHRDDHPAGKVDGVSHGATAIVPKAAGAEYVRSLFGNGEEWNFDPADWFTFTGAAGAYYRFALTETTGAPEVHVYTGGVRKVSSEDDLVEITDYMFLDDPTACIQIASAGKVPYYVKVAHQEGCESDDSAYTLVATSVNPGVVKFAKTAVTVRDSAGYVDLSVSRTGREGLTRVDYATEGEQSSAGDALYYPTTGTLVWEDGDNKAKTIRVKLVPQDYGRGGSFKVTLSAAEIADEGNELPAIFQDGKSTTAGPVSATVTVTAAAKAAPGTIRLADCATPKKPVVTVTAGECVELLFERVSGTDGIVGVTCEAVKGKAKPGTDYEAPGTRVLEWDDREGGANGTSIRIQTLAVPDDYTPVKAFTVRLTAKTGKAESGEKYARPTLAASTVTINVANEKFASTAAAYAKALPKTGGVALKESKAGTWFVREDGSMFSSAKTGTLTFALTGPGVFRYAVDGGEERFLVVPYGEKKKNTVVIEAGQTLSWYRWEPLPENLVTLRQCVKYARVLTNGISKLAAGKLPDGLKLAQDKATKRWFIGGTPTKAGYFYVKLTDAVKGKAQPTVVEEINYEVVAAGTAVGTFSGLVETSDTDDGLRSLASVTLTAAATGKLSGKVLVGGKTYGFTDTGYASFDDAGEYPTVTAELPLVQKIGSGKTAETVTNWLTCTVVDAPETNAVARRAEATCEVAFAKLADATGRVWDGDVRYEGVLCRDNSKVADWVAEASAFAGYHTVSLVNGQAAEGEPKGNGYLTLTFDAKGKVRIAGVLADGVSYSASSVSACLVERLDGTAIRLPLYACKSPYVFGGWLELVPGEDGAPVVSSDAKLTWANDAATATREGESGFSLELTPVGGWYDTVTNLQKWFLEYDFSVDLPTWEDDFGSFLPIGYETYAFAANPCGQAVDVCGDTVSVVKQSLVKDAATKLYDFGESVNASNVKIAFKRATGVLTGTFDLWYEGYNAKTKKTEQKSVAGLRHNGILLLSRDEGEVLESDVWTSGFYLVPQKLPYTDAKGRTGTRKWTGSYRFDVKATYVGRDWDATPPVAKSAAL